MQEEPKPLKRPAVRRSVSAESYGLFNQPPKDLQRCFEKSAEQLEFLRTALHKEFLFESLLAEDLDSVLKAFELKRVEAGSAVIHEGDEHPTELFLVHEGELSCTKQEEEVKRYSAGELFGELALLYSSRRQASITAVTDSQLWALDR